MSNDTYDLVERVLTGEMSRGQMIRRLLGTGLTVGAVGGLLSESGLGTVADAERVAAPPRAVKRGGTLRFAVQVPASDVDPVTMFNEGAIVTAQTACEYLVGVSPSYALKPKLAASWKASAPDTWTFNLRQGVKWHNGADFTADDVVATFDRITDPAVKSAGLSAFKGILSKGNTKKVDAHTVTFHLDRGFVDFPYLLSPLTYNSAVLPKNYKIGDFVKGGVGTGPYMLTSYTPKTGAQFKKNPHYWASGLPYLDGVNIVYYADQSAIVPALEAGSVDTFTDMPYQGSQPLFNNKNITILTNPSSAYREFHMRVDRNPFKDERVRQAVAYCLDRPALVKTLLHGYGKIGNDHAFAPVFPLSKVTSKIAQRKRDIAKAKKLLAQAGHHNGIKVTLTTEQYLEIPQYATLVKAQCKAAGIDISLNIEDQNTYYGSGSNQPWLDVPMGIVDWAPRGVPSQLIDPAYLTGAIWNSAHWADKRYDNLVNGADKQLSTIKRENYVIQAASIQHTQVPAVIAYWINDLSAVRSNVHGVPKGPAPYPDLSAVWIG